MIQNVWSPVYVNALVLRDRDTNGDGTLDERLYFTSDANYNVTSVISGGSVDQREVYGPYGAVAFKNSSFATSSDGYGLAFLYQGMLYDASIGWYYSGESNNGRWYSPTLQVWGRPDDDGFINGTNETIFVGDNVINSTDPTGMWKYVPDMGTFSATLANGGAAWESDSEFHLKFTPKAGAFDNAKCDEIRFIQTFVFHGDGLGLQPAGDTYLDAAWQRGKAYLDSLSGDLPWFPDYGKEVGNPSLGQSSSMGDEPWMKPINFQSYFSIFFQTAAVASKGPDKGNVYGVVSWSVEYFFSGALVRWQKLTGVARTIEGQTVYYDPDHHYRPKGEDKQVASLGDATLDEQDIAGHAPETNLLKKTLSKYFP